MRKPEKEKTAVAVRGTGQWVAGGRNDKKIARLCKDVFLTGG